ncbi:uncharacterized protein LOC127080645 [Lathyrus oleraceus]|uniref:uncharacterized protein LOC127080645 n=1 Tax=Pisum sativum TaxID=3888 RepID=UPI0021CFF4E6|nr:uncharacterized protein LOC127080645 [Pisum sativum]
MGEEEKIAGILESKNLETMKFEDLVGSLEAPEMRIVERKGVQDLIQAPQAQTWKKHGGSNKFNGKGDKNQNKKSWPNPQKHKVDDRASEFSKRGEGNSYQKDKEEKKKVCVAINVKNGVTWPRIVVADDHVDSKIWFLDTCCSNHMTGRKVWLEDFDDLKKNNVKLADNSSLQAEGTGDIYIQRRNGAKDVIKDVLYVPVVAVKNQRPSY